jgi:hypothetical protein
MGPSTGSSLVPTLSRLSVLIAVANLLRQQPQSFGPRTAETGILCGLSISPETLFPVAGDSRDDPAFAVKLEEFALVHVRDE